MMTPIRKPTVYLAGKIGRNDWRHELVPELRGTVNGDCLDPEPVLFDPTLRIDCGDFVYVGPFFVSCDHGCFHGPASHGAVGAPDEGLSQAERGVLHGRCLPSTGTVCSAPIWCSPSSKARTATAA
jgi:hypothetical protein